MSKIIILNNKIGQIETDEQHLKNIRNLCSYKQPGVEYTAQYQNYNWSGIVHLINKKNQFSLGLLKTIENYFIENNVAYSIEDKRVPIISEIPLDISENLNKLNLIPRDYQLRILEAVKDQNRGIVRAATGSGKSLVAALITAHFNKPTIIYVIGLDLLDQFHKLFSSIFNEKIGYIGNGVCDIENTKIIIASVWTVGKCLDLKPKDIILDDDLTKEKFNQNHKLKINQCIKEAKIHLLDECHISSCATISQIYKNINPERIFGLSGTPFRDMSDDIVITSIFGEKIVEVSASELIEKKVLAQPIIKFVKVPKLYVEGQNYQTIYKEYVVENAIRNNLIIKHTKSVIEKGYKPLVLFRNIAHGKILFELAQQNGIRCGLLSGKDKLENRNKVKEQLNNGEIDCIIASIVFDVGVDLPILSSLILAGGGRSYYRALQRVGRCIRQYPGKTNVVIIDFYDDIRYLKTHSKKRYQIYSSEPGFKIIPCPEIL